MGQPLSPPLKLSAERGNVASPVMILMLKRANPLHTHRSHTCCETHTHTWLLGEDSTTQAVGEEQRNETEGLRSPRSLVLKTRGNKKPRVFSGNVDGKTGKKIT